jgi:RNA polymerase sigma factor (sigma-70 family)
LEKQAEPASAEPTNRPAVERARLLRLCARLTGDLDAAEDLAQETLVEAWRHEHELRDPARRSQWLAGIARNLCLMWARSRAREPALLVQRRADDGSPPDLDAWAADDFDLEIELERHELADLLDRAMALLPPDTRHVLVERYVRESPQAEIAARLGLAENTVAKRLERGRLALKRVLTTDLAHEAAAYGLGSAGADAWRETRIWCTLCGRRRLLGRFAEGRDLQLDCPGCIAGSRAIAMRGRIAEPLLGGITSAQLLKGIKGYKPALTRLLARIHEFYQHGVAGHTARCSRCGTQAPLRMSVEDFRGFHDVQTDCPRCGQTSGISTVSALALMRPEGRTFWRVHRRIRALPERELEAGGVAALVSTLESATGGAKLEVIFARETLRVIGVHGG